MEQCLSRLKYFITNTFILKRQVVKLIKLYTCPCTIKSLLSKTFWFACDGNITKHFPHQWVTFVGHNFAMFTLKWIIKILAKKQFEKWLQDDTRYYEIFESTPMSHTQLRKYPTKITLKYVHDLGPIPWTFHNFSSDVFI